MLPVPRSTLLLLIGFSFLYAAIILFAPLLNTIITTLEDPQEPSINEIFSDLMKEEFFKFSILLMGAFMSLGIPITVIGGILLAVDKLRKKPIGFYSTRKVNLTWQTIFAIIPLIEFFAFGRIRKFRKYFLIVIGYFGLGFLLGYVIPDFTTNVTVNTAIMIPINAYLVRKWSEQWNKSFESKEYPSKGNTTVFLD
ncbi:MAG TPA: hypothetical protein VD731_03375 [Nitrosopumilaceae archaeon]|nr:hypothetical protein [Nitrosopumilaceae archaeon]